MLYTRRDSLGLLSGCTILEWRRLKSLVKVIARPLQNRIDSICLSYIELSPEVSGRLTADLNFVGHPSYIGVE